jgi:hypothetical protein
LPIFSAGVQAERHPPLARCAVVIAVGWCPKAAAPHTSRGSPAIGMALTARVGLVLCALATSLYPHTVRLKGRAAHLCAPVRLRCGGGAATCSGGIDRPMSGVGARVPSTAAGSGIQGLHAPPRSTTPCQSSPAPHAKAHPIKVQFGHRLASSAPRPMEKLVPVEGGVTLEHVGNRPGKFLGEDAPRLARAMCVLQARAGLLPHRMMPEQEDGCFRRPT